MVATIDLGKAEINSEVVFYGMEQPGSWIYRPSSIEVLVSADNNNFLPVAKLDKKALEFLTDVRRISIPLQPHKEARYIKVVARNHGMIPAGKPGAGHKAWLFSDEIEIN